jgi:ABC-2 type transport system permease protein
VFVLSLMAFSSVGVLSASFTLMFKRGDPLLWLFGSASWLLGGVLYPTDSLPLPLQWVATLLPITHAADGMRAAILGGGSTRMLLGNLGALAGFALIGVPASIFMFTLAVDHAKRAGTLDHR